MDASGRSSELLSTDAASRVRALVHVLLQLFDHGLGLIRKGRSEPPQHLAVGKVACAGTPSGCCPCRLHPELAEGRQIQLITYLLHPAARASVRKGSSAFKPALGADSGLQSTA